MLCHTTVINFRKYLTSRTNYKFPKYKCFIPLFNSLKSFNTLKDNLQKQEVLNA